MDPLTIGATLAFGLGAYLLGRYRPGLRDRLADVERYCRIAFAAVEFGAAALGLKTGASKLAAYLERAERLVRSAGLPWSKAERTFATELAARLAESAKREAGELALRRALEELGRRGEEVDRWAAKLGARDELAAGAPPSARKDR
jgi:hypothetical protein